MKKPIIEYSAEAIGQTWTQADHVYLWGQIRKIEALAEEMVIDARKQNAERRRMRELEAEMRGR